MRVYHHWRLSVFTVFIDSSKEGTLHQKGDVDSELLIVKLTYVFFTI